jgi:hypothetical protein
VNININIWIPDNKDKAIKNSFKELLFSLNNCVNVISKFDWIKDDLSKKAYIYSRFTMKKPWPECESLILHSAKYSYLYARYVLKARWEKAESIIFKNKEYSYYYAKFVLKDKLPENIEKEFLKVNSYDNGKSYGYEIKYAYFYAKYVLKSRFKKAENKISKSEYALDYACSVIKKRWEKIEEEIIAKTYKRYKKVNQNLWGPNGHISLNEITLDKIVPNLYFAKIYFKILKEEEKQSFIKKLNILSFCSNIELQRGAKLLLLNIEELSK